MEIVLIAKGSLVAFFRRIAGGAARVQARWRLEGAAVGEEGDSGLTALAPPACPGAGAFCAFCDFCTFAMRVPE